MKKKDRQIVLVLLVLIVITLGIASRKYTEVLPVFVAEYAGDTLYALCSYLLFRILFLSKSWPIAACCSFIFCLLIEMLQLYQAPWIQSIRNTPSFGMILGYGFLWTDLICYAAGVCIAILVEVVVARFFKSRSRMF